MAKEKEEVKEEVKKEVKSEKQIRWEAFLAKAEKQNPEKFAIKKARGIFDSIPADFV